MSSPATIFAGAGAGAALPFHLTRISSSISNLSITLKAPTFTPLLTSLSRRGHLRVQLASVRDSVDELGEELELLEKPSPPSPPEAAVDGEEVVEEAQGEQQLGPDEVLAPFLKFFKGKDGSDGGDGELGPGELRPAEGEGLRGKVLVEYYQPLPGDIVVGVVVSGNENKLDVNVGADLLGTMLTKEVMPLYGQELSYLQCDLSKDAEAFMVPGKIGIVKDDEAFDRQYVHGRPVVEVGTVLFAEVLGRTLSGRPLLSTRRLFRRVAWHRVRQINQLNEPIEVKITEWNTGGLLTRIEGLRAFLPKVELMNRAKSFSALKENVGRKITVLITRVDELKNDLIISERQAWDKLHLEEGTLLEGTVLKIFPYGAQVRIGDSNRSGLLHISNISRARVSAVSEVLSEDDKVKVLVVRSMFPERISLSIADLESESGLFLSNKEKVFAEAQEMARRYRQKLPTVAAARKLEPIPSDGLSFSDDAGFYANWHWFRFEEIKEPNGS